MTPANTRCHCDPCQLPRAKGGRCQSEGTLVYGVLSSHCFACAQYCADDDDEEADRG